jgi:hypothetical protein
MSDGINCKLSHLEFRERKATMIAELKSLAIARIEIPNGYQYTFSGSDQLIDLLVAFIKALRQCANFMEFKLTTKDPAGHTLLELTGPEGVKEFIDQQIEF